MLTNSASLDVFVQLMDFPNKTKETVTPNEDGSFTIFINARLSHDAQLKAYAHALKHIEGNDFAKDNVQQIEYEAHKEKYEPIPAQKYVEELIRLKRERAALKKKMKKDEERIKFLQKNVDMFAYAENQWLYGSDL